MSRQERDRNQTSGRREDQVSGQGNTARRADDTGMAGGRAGVDAESVDFDDMGDLDRGADDRREAEPSHGPGPGYGAGNATTVDAGPIEPDANSMARYQQGTGPGLGPASAMRVADVTGGMGSDVGDKDGIGQGLDRDPTAERGQTLSTGTNPRAGLGGRSSGKETDLDPSAGAPIANPADMGDQG